MRRTKPTSNPSRRPSHHPSLTGPLAWWASCSSFVRMIASQLPVLHRQLSVVSSSLLLIACMMERMAFILTSSSSPAIGLSPLSIPFLSLIHRNGTAPYGIWFYRRAWASPTWTSTGTLAPAPSSSSLIFPHLIDIRQGSQRGRLGSPRNQTTAPPPRPPLLSSFSASSQASLVLSVSATWLAGLVTKRRPWRTIM